MILPQIHSNAPTYCPLQEAVIKTMEQKHVQERMALLELLQHEVTGDDKLLADNMTSEQRQERLQEIWGKRLAQQFSEYSQVS